MPVRQPKLGDDPTVLTRLCDERDAPGEQVVLEGLPDFDAPAPKPAIAERKKNGENEGIHKTAAGYEYHKGGFYSAPKHEGMEDTHNIHNVKIVGIPFDSGTTYRPGTRFGPQGIRRISALYNPYNYELGVDLREQMTLCDAGDVFTIPANLEKSFDQITRGVSHVASSGALPLMLGGDHSIGFPCVRGIADVTSKRIGIIHFDRHIDIQEKDLDERMHTTPWFWATNLPNVSATNLVQLGIGHGDEQHQMALGQPPDRFDHQLGAGRIGEIGEYHHQTATLQPPGERRQGKRNPRAVRAGRRSGAGVSRSHAP